MLEQNLSNTQVDVSPDQQPQQDIQSPSENWIPDLPPSASHIYTIVVFAVLVYGIAKGDLLFICIPCVMAIALLGPWALKMFLPFIKEIFQIKGTKSK